MTVSPSSRLATFRSNKGVIASSKSPNSPTFVLEGSEASVEVDGRFVPMLSIKFGFGVVLLDDVRTNSISVR